MDINLCDPSVRLGDAEGLSPAQRYLFRLVELKKELGVGGFERGNYFSNILPIVASGVSFAARMAYCGRKTEWNGNGACQQWRFCSKCANACQNKAIATYLPAFIAGRFCFITTSFRGSLRIEAKEEMAVALDYWNAIDQALKALVTAGVMRGAYSVEEVSIQDLVPLRIRPHVHSVVHADWNDDRDRQSAVEDLASRLAQCAQLQLPPSIHSVELPSRDSLAKTLSYCTKAVDLTKIYCKSIADYGEESPALKQELSHEMQTFLLGWSGITAGRYAIRKRGSMHHASKAFIGTKMSHSERRSYLQRFHADRLRLSRTINCEEKSPKARHGRLRRI